ncbi:hypothetical protein PT974_09613 [Cladobotryum mycophilum]|uniref:Apple domain-containing protein n=1 Tax=Cladobotryum mycophilum TaxID=491253 RepID=A0ABR0SGN8_9HYPO
MKLAALSVVLSAVQAVQAGGPVCRDPAPSCRVVPASSSKVCASIIKSKRIDTSTCEAPSATTTRTYTVTTCPTSTITKTLNPPANTRFATLTLTVTDPNTHYTTSTVWATVTLTAGITVVDSVTTTSTATATSVETDNTLIVVTNTITQTAVASWAPETCAPVNKRSGQCREGDIPRDCSCFLTSTKSCGPRTTKAVTVTKIDTPKTITKTIDNRSTPTITITKTVIAHITGAPPPVQTVTSTTTDTTSITDRSTTTVEQVITNTLSSTTTVTSSATSTVTQAISQTENPCAPANLPKYYVKGIPSNPNVVLGFQSDGGNNPSICCQNCMNNFNCVYWVLSQNGALCQGYFTKPGSPVEGCTSTRCPRGHPVLQVSPPSNANIYGMAQCGRFP